MLRAANQSIDQSINQSIDQSINQSINVFVSGMNPYNKDRETEKIDKKEQQKNNVHILCTYYNNRGHTSLLQSSNC